MEKVQFLISFMFKVEEVLHDSGWLQVSLIKNFLICSKVH